jgi:hypothetical protein
MAAWLPVLKASLPYVTQVITAAIPAFTSKSASGKADEIVPKQIAELQSAVTRNAETAKTLATELKRTIEGLEAGASKLQQELDVLRRLALVALVLAVVSLSAAVSAVFGGWAS